jgi:hypothetical protein
MKTYILILLLLLKIAEVRSQVIINPQLAPLGLSQKAQLWNLSIVNASNDAMEVQVQLQLTDIRNNQKIFSATTRIFSLQKGLKQFSANDFAPITYNVLSPDYNVNSNPEGFLPIGTFNICYTVLRVPLSHIETLAEDCEAIQVEPLMPPQLVQPSDSEVVEPKRPLFSWLPPAPYNLFTNLAYDFSLVEVNNLQSSAEAIEQNIPLQTQQNLNVSNLQYPVSLPELDTGKIYAWRITARSAGNPISESEIWTFTIKKTKTDSTSSFRMNYYAKVKATDDASYIVCDGGLKFQYQNQYNDNGIPLKVWDITTSRRTEIRLDSSYAALHFGQNLINLDLTGKGLLTEKHTYLLEIINSRNEHWYLKFEYRK